MLCVMQAQSSTLLARSASGPFPHRVCTKFKADSGLMSSRACSPKIIIALFFGPPPERPTRTTSSVTTSAVSVVHASGVAAHFCNYPSFYIIMRVYIKHCSHRCCGNRDGCTTNCNEQTEQIITIMFRIMHTVIKMKPETRY